MLPTTCPVCQHQPLAIEGYDAVCNKCRVYRKRLKWWQQVLVWTRDKQWYWRLAPIAFFMWLFVQCLQTDQLQRNNPVALLDFGMHELGHILFIPFGVFMTILGGSLFQCLFPLLWLGASIWKRWYVAAALCLAWFGYNLYDVAVYVADARARLLPLATFSNNYDSAHDWYQILSRLNMLDQDLAIARTLQAIAATSMIIGLVVALLLVAAMFYSRYRPVTAEQADDEHTAA